MANAPKGLFGGLYALGQQGLLGGVPNPFAAPAVAQAAREAIPAHVRIFASTLAGDRSPITEKNYTPEDLAMLRALIARNQANPFYKKGAVTYGDYTDANAATPQGSESGGAGGRAHVGPVYGGFGFGNPQLTHLANTVGQFVYKTQPDGSITINDHYDWDSGRPDGGNQQGRPSLVDALTNLLSTGSAEQLGAWAAPDDQHGRQINITLPPQKPSGP